MRRWRDALRVLAALGAAFVLPPAASGAAEVDLAALLEQARAETAARTLRAPDASPLCFPPAAAVAGTEAHIVPAFRISGGNRDSGERELSGYVDVYIEQTETPVLLILRAHDSIIWRLHLSEDARLGAVHLMGYAENFVVGVPAGVPVTSRFDHPLKGGQEEYCVFAEDGPGGVAYLPPMGIADASQRASDRYGAGSFAYVSGGAPQGESQEVRFIRNQLREYAGIPIVSYPGWSGERIEVSRRAIAYYEAIRQRGRDWLAANPLPAIATLGADTAMLAVPEELTSVAAMEWLAARGYAERTGRDIVEYLCGRRLALALLEGEDVYWKMAIRNCAERQFSTKMFTLLGPVRITRRNCKGKSSSDYAALLVPPDVELDWDNVCSWPRFRYPRGG